ncbi:galactose mutarotase [Pedobacter sp. MC2016-14]|uniref:aldose epimerase family protein n=1 Tax=Pedobacter sp. MC2016-14 TaxID=2897327 RepID=UPI001E3A2E51|nr:aldose epimerase family protein [Pedobacter sp. MC2016-14]MCD0490030.1 galactose mutarotase [Pedobacter sp. MC2016-14]
MKLNLVKTGHVIDEKEVFAVELTNIHGTYVKIYNYGAIVSNFVVQNAKGEKQDIVLGFDNFDQYIGENYLANYPYLGAVIGRYANRIKDGKFSVSGQEYQLELNDPPNCLHSGYIGFDKKVWDILPTIDPSLTLQYTSPDGEGNFPGNLTVQLTFKLTDDNELVLDYKARTDKATIVNLTHHGYFNLAEEGGNIKDHMHRMPASHYLEQDENYVVTGKLIPVEGSSFDFLASKKIGLNWNPDEGYDQTFVLDKVEGELTMASETSDENSGLKFSVFTTAPVAHFYTAKHLMVHGGKNGKDYSGFDAFCVETQHHPNSVNVPEFTGTVLMPGETYKQTTIYKIETAVIV